MIDNPLLEMSEQELQRLARAGRLFLRITGNWRGAQGTRQNSSEGAGLEFRELRPYSPGDDVRHVDWRATLRREITYLRTYENELTDKWYICLDCSGSMSRPDRSRFRLAVQLVAAFAYMLLDAGNSVGMIAFNDAVYDYCPPGTGRHQYARLAARLSHLGVQETIGTSNLATVAPRLRDACHLVVISDFLQPDAMIGGLRALQMRGRQVHALQIGSERDAPNVGPRPTDLRDVETGERLTVMPGAHAAAKAQLAVLNRRLGEYCRLSGVALTTCSAAEPWLTTMLRHGGVRLA